MDEFSAQHFWFYRLDRLGAFLSLDDDAASHSFGPTTLRIFKLSSFDLVWVGRVYSGSAATPDKPNP
jgi:hypothetical protein